MRKISRSIFAIILVLSVVFSTVVLAEYIPDPEIVQIDNPAGWTGSSATMDIIGKELTLNYLNTDKSAAVYSDISLTNESIEFKGKFDVQSGGWIAMRLRTDMPEYYVWDCHEGYFFLVRPGFIEFDRSHAKGIGETGTVANIEFDLCDGNEHTIRLGAQDYSGKTYVTLMIDGNSVYRYTDSNPLTLDSGCFSLNCYGNGTSVKVNTMGANEYWDNNPVSQPVPDINWTEMKDPSGWFINAAKIVTSVTVTNDGHMTYDNGNTTFTGIGSITTVNKINARSFGFTASVKTSSDSASDYADYIFIKSGRLTLGCTTGYALRLYPDGRLQLMRYLNGSIQTFPAFRTGKDFTQKHSFVVELNKTGLLSCEIFIYVDGEGKAYRYKDEMYGPNLQASGYFCINNSSFNVTSTISDMKFAGTETYVKDTTATEQVLLPDYLVEEDGRKMLHWIYNLNYAFYKGVSVSDAKGNKLGFVNYPDNIFVLPDDHTYTQLIITAVRADGKEAVRQIVDLTTDFRSYVCDSQQRVSVKKAETGATFVKEDGSDFFVKGVNYIGLRYGDHSTFEPAIENVNTADYDPLEAETALKTIAMYGYNTVRTFVVTGVRRSGNTGLTGIYDTANGLYIPYMENIIDFLRRCQKYGIYMIPNFCENEMISNKYFRDLSGRTSAQGLLFSQDGMNAKAEYIRLFANYIKEREESLLNAILGIQAQNEFCFFNTAEPFNRTSGTYTYFDGTTYNMADNDSRHELAMNALKTYYKTIREALDTVDKDIMLCEGTFTLMAVGKDPSDPNVRGINPAFSGTDNRFPVTVEEYLDTAIDFLDIHIYHASKEITPEQTMDANLDNMRYNTTYCKTLLKNKPVILGEYGDCRSSSLLSDTYIVSEQILRAAIKNGMQGGIYWMFQNMGVSADNKDGTCQKTLEENLARLSVGRQQ